MSNNKSTEKNLAQCKACHNLCCKYITVKITAPRTMRDFDGLLWQVAHDNVSALRDHGGWHLIIYNTCSHLKKNGECAIYDQRPITCREHPADECEYDNPILEAAYQFFGDYESLNNYCKKKFKTWERRF